MAILTGQFSDEPETPRVPVAASSVDTQSSSAPVISADAPITVQSAGSNSRVAASSVMAGSDLATTLSLPINRTVTYYNRATNMAFREACQPEVEKSISCTLDVLGMTAQIRHTLQTTYTRNDAGVISAVSQKIDASDWSRDNGALYKEAKANAVNHEWTAGSPLARVAINTAHNIIQGGLFELTAIGNNGVALCSSTAIGENRAIDSCVAFNGATNEVKSAALPRVGTGAPLNELLTKPEAAIRDFNIYDADYLEQHKAQLNPAGGPAYILRH